MLAVQAPYTHLQVATECRREGRGKSKHCEMENIKQEDPKSGHMHLPLLCWSMAKLKGSRRADSAGAEVSGTRTHGDEKCLRGRVMVRSCILAGE